MQFCDRYLGVWCKKASISDPSMVKKTKKPKNKPSVNQLQLKSGTGAAQVFFPALQVLFSFAPWGAGSLEQLASHPLLPPGDV